MAGRERALSLSRAPWWVAYGVTTFLAFPHPVGGGVMDLGLPLAFLSPLLLLRAIRGLPPRAALGLGFLAGWLAYSLILHWIYVVTVIYGRAPAPVGLVAILALASYIAAFVAAQAWGAAWLARGGADRPWFVAALFVAVDHARTIVFTGFPWATLGYALHQDAPALGLVTVTGVYGLSFLAVLVGASLASAMAGERRPAALGLGLAALLHGVGAVLPRVESQVGEPIRVGIAQGNIEQGVKWSPEWADRTMQIYEEQTREAAAQGAEVVVWPETAVPGSPDGDPALRRRIERLSDELGVVLFVGAVGLEGVDRERGGAVGPVSFFDSVFLVSPGTGMGERYDKTHLVPFGEFVPFRWLWGRLLSGVATGMTQGDVSEGERPRAFLASAGPGGAAVPVAAPICYELIFPDLMRRFAADGARVFFAVTNDAWYGHTGAPYQFFVMSVMRAVESGVPLVRAANTGISGFVDARGKVRRRSAVFEREVLVEDVWLAPPDRVPTFYARYGDVFAAGCWVVAGILVFRTRRRIES